MSSTEPRYAQNNGWSGPVDPSRLWQVRGGHWAEPHPIECPNGHKLGPGKVLVGWQACPAVPRSGHRLHHCLTCDTTIHTPPVTEDCAHTAFDSRT